VDSFARTAPYFEFHVDLTLRRVEAFNIYAEVYVVQQSFWYYITPLLFQVEVFLYCFMIAEMLLVLAVFSTKKGNKGSFISSSAAVFGLVISVMCLFFLLVAETKRCHPHDNNTLSRLLATEPLKEHDDPVDVFVEGCAKFGERKYGGLGKIEPFTSLIALYPIRHLVASYISNSFGSRSISEEVSHVDQESHHRHHGPDPTAEVRGLWLTAIGVHSEIAKTCGLFSGELLQCMLGVYFDPNSNANGKESVTSAGHVQSTCVNNEVSDNEACQHHVKENNKIKVKSSSRRPMDSLNTPTINRYMPVDVEVSLDSFAYPKARLVRSMRRCEKRHLPLMDSWMVVDAVLTSHELILFDVIDENDDLDLMPRDTRGYKGLYLSDVAKGRKIVSQFNLDEIDFVDIEHRAPLPQGEIEVDGVDARHNCGLREYWQGGNISCEDYEVNAMDKRWSHVDEDILRIQFKDSTLFLRFMADLNEKEHRNKALDNVDGIGFTIHVGTQVKVWCLTFLRYVVYSLPLKVSGQNFLKYLSCLLWSSL
jgi:hypothetical protein